MKAEEWFSAEYAYQQFYDEKIRNLFKKFKEEFNKYSLNAKSIQTFSREEVEIVIGKEHIFHYYYYLSEESYLCNGKKNAGLIVDCDYQEELQSMGSFDVDDVIMEALSHLNAPAWRSVVVKLFWNVTGKQRKYVTG